MQQFKFNATEYWSSKPIKKWVVSLAYKPGTRMESGETKYVSAKDRSGAIRTALANSWLPRPVKAIGCRLAEPNDLGCR